MRNGLNVFGALRLLKYIHSEKFDLVHSHGYKANILLGFIPEFIRCFPMISTLHGYTTTTGFSRMKIYEWLSRLSYKFIDSVVLVNKEMLNHPKFSNRKDIDINLINF